MENNDACWIFDYSYAKSYNPFVNLNYKMTVFVRGEQDLMLPQKVWKLA